MITIENSLTTLNDYFLWTFDQLGIQRWQFLTAACALLVVLMIIRKFQQKTASRTKAALRVGALPDTIGASLANRDTTSLLMHQAHRQNTPTAVAPKTINPSRGWRQATEEWKSSAEKCKQLQREITKSKRSEEHLRFQIGEMKKEYEMLLHENMKLKQTETELKQIVSDLAIVGKHQVSLGHEDTESQSETETTKRHGIPLDVQELETIATLARRLRNRKEDFQKEPL
jgi:hypothetical protein